MTDARRTSSDMTNEEVEELRAENLALEGELALLRDADSAKEEPANMPEQDKGAQVTLYVAGVNPEQDRVVVVVEVTGARQFKAKFLYDLSETKAFCMDLVAAGNTLEEARPKGLIVLPPAGNTRLPGSRRRP